MNQRSATFRLLARAATRHVHRRVFFAQAWSLCAALCVIAFVHGPARAESRLALVMGNASYAFAPLLNPVNDSRAMAAALEAVGFDVIALEDASQTEMRRGVVEFGKRLREDGGVGLFYYAGHGVQVDGRNYMIPIGAQIEAEEEVRVEAVDVDYLLARMDSAGNPLNIVILDACRNNPYARSFRGLSRGLASIDAPSGTLIAYATAPGHVALDGDGPNSFYTGTLAETVSVPGLEIGDVFKRVRVKVQELTDGVQVPWESSSMTGDFYFLGDAHITVEVVSDGAGPSVDVLFWETIKDSDDPALYEEYLRQFPDGTFAAVARRRAEGAGGSRRADLDPDALFWDSIKDSDDPALFAAYLKAFPDGAFVEIARVKTAPDETLTVASAASATQQRTLGEVEEMAGRFVVLTAANIREAPTTSSARIGSVGKGARVSVTGRMKNAAWYRIAHGGGVGFIHQSLVEQADPARLAALDDPPPVAATAPTIPATPRIPWMGAHLRAVYFDRVGSPEYGNRLQIHSVAPLGPAEAAGLRPGDTILDADGRPIYSLDTLEAILGPLRPRDRVAFLVANPGHQTPYRKVAVTLAPESDAALVIRMARAASELLDHNHVLQLLDGPIETGLFGTYYRAEALALRGRAHAALGDAAKADADLAEVNRIASADILRAVEARPRSR